MGNIFKYIYRCMVGVVNKDYRNKVLNIKTPNCLFVEEYGEKNPNQVILLIKCDMPYSGWFSMINEIINPLEYADKYNFVPVIALGKSKLYSEEHVQKDLFEYYYDSPGGISYLETMESRNVVIAHSAFYNYFAKANEMVYDQDDALVIETARLTRKYFHFNSEMENYLFEKLEYLHKYDKIIGVHVRGTDFRAQYKDHPYYVEVESYINEVSRMLEKDSDCMIFLATDEEQTVEKFKLYFGKKVLYNDVYRAKTIGNVGIHSSTENRENHHYELGREVLLDMIALSYCSILICTRSFVPYYSIINKLSRGERYTEIKVLNRGVSKSGKDSARQMKKIVANRKG